MDIKRVNPEFLKFPEDIQKKLVERVQNGDTSLILMTEKELEKELRLNEANQVSEIYQKPLSRGMNEIVNRANNVYELQGLFDTQVNTLLKKEFPKHAGMSEKEFLSHIIPLKEKLPEIANMDMPEGHIPFVIVVGEKLLSLEKKIPLMGLKGFTSLNPTELKTADGVKIPKSMAYLIVDVGNGKAMLGKSANEAVKQFKKEGRSPLTVGDGVALVIQYPKILEDQPMDLPGSRRGDDEVAYLRLYGGKPELDWGWAYGSDAKWGSASCGSRVR